MAFCELHIDGMNADSCDCLNEDCWHCRSRMGGVAIPWPDEQGSSATV
jgi:hypothetical protein